MRVPRVGGVGVGVEVGVGAELPLLPEPGSVPTRIAHRGHLGRPPGKAGSHLELENLGLEEGPKIAFE